MKLNIAVLFGHKSCEHDISIITACHAMKNIDTEKYNIIPIYITKENKYITGQNLKQISNYPNNIKGKEIVFLPNSNYVYLKSKFGLKKRKRIDCALFCFHGNMGENGAMQGLFELNNIPYTSTGLVGSINGMNKVLFKEILKGIKVPSVQGVEIKDEEYFLDKNKCVNKTIKLMSLPLIVKPSELGSSIGIGVANSKIELNNALKQAFELGGSVLVEKYVSSFKEVNVAVLYDGEKYIFSEFEEAIKNDNILSFKDKYISGGKKNIQTATYLGGNIKASLTEVEIEKIRKYTLKVALKLNLKGVVRFDYIITKDKIYLNEINTIPGSLANYLFKSKGLNYKNLLDILINSAIVENSKKNNYLSYFESSVLENNTNGVKKWHKTLSNKCLTK